MKNILNTDLSFKFNIINWFKSHLILNNLSVTWQWLFKSTFVVQNKNCGEKKNSSFLYRLIMI